MLQYDLSDAQEHLGQLLREMQEQPGFGEAAYRVWLAHIYAHLNRAWNRRGVTDAEEVGSQEQPDCWAGWTSFPADIEPL